MVKQVKVEYTPEYITIADYIRRKHELMLKTDPLAKPVDRGAVMRAIDRGDIIPYRQGKFKFIDWKAAKDLIFRQYFQMPVSAPRKIRSNG